MEYQCIEKTFYDKIYNPGDVYNAAPNEEYVFVDNPCWKNIEPIKPPAPLIKKGEPEKKGSGK